jgi:endonuclease G
VPGLNRAPGIWGQLEKAVLEKGIKKQTDKDEIKMSVFNGPVFNEETDKIFKGVRVPMEFFKIIVWLDDAKKLKATAFKLSQKLLLSDVHFDESMRIDEEALDINKVVEFKNYQCSIDSISKATKIDFKGLEKFDTFKSKAGTNESLITSEESIAV